MGDSNREHYSKPVLFSLPVSSFSSSVPELRSSLSLSSGDKRFPPGVLGLGDSAWLKSSAAANRRSSSRSKTSGVDGGIDSGAGEGEMNKVFSSHSQGQGVRRQRPRVFQTMECNRIRHS